MRAAVSTSPGSFMASPSTSSSSSSPFGSHLRLPMPPSPEEEATDVLICSDSEDDDAVAGAVNGTSSRGNHRGLVDDTPRVMAAARYSEAKNAAAARAAAAGGALASSSSSGDACPAGQNQLSNLGLSPVPSSAPVVSSSLPSMFSLSTKLVSNPAEDPLTIVQSVLADEPKCEELLVQVESLARLWDLPLASRTFRDNLPASLAQRIGIPASDKNGMLYPVNILRAACMPSSNVLLNDRVYIFSQTLVANSANIRDSFAELIKMIHDTHGHEDDTPGWRRNKHSWLAFHCFFRHTTSSKRKHIRRVLKRFDEAWREFERCYAREMKAILVEARKPMLEAIEVEATVERLETSYNNRPGASVTSASARSSQTVRMRPTQPSTSASTSASSSPQQPPETTVGPEGSASRVNFRVARFVDKLLELKGQQGALNLSASFDTAAPLTRLEVARLAQAIRVIDAADPNRHGLDKSRRNPFTDTQHLRLFKLLHRFCNMISSATRTPVDQQYIDVSVFQTAEEYFRRKLSRESTPTTRTFRASRSLPVVGPDAAALRLGSAASTSSSSLFDRASSMHFGRPDDNSKAGSQSGSHSALQLDPVCMLYGDVLAAYSAFRSCLRRYRTHVHDLSPQITENTDLTRTVLDLQRAFRAAGRFAAHHNRRLGLTVLTELMVELIATDDDRVPQEQISLVAMDVDAVGDSSSGDLSHTDGRETRASSSFSFGSACDLEDSAAEGDSVYERLQYSDPDTLFSLPCFLLWRALLRGDPRCQSVILAFYPHASLSDEDYIAASRLAGRVRAVLGACSSPTSPLHPEDLTPSVCGSAVCAACQKLPVDLFLSSGDNSSPCQEQETKVRTWLGKLASGASPAGSARIDSSLIQVPEAAVAVVTEFAERLRRCSARLQRSSAVEWNESIMLGVEYITRIIDHAQ